MTGRTVQGGVPEARMAVYRFALQTLDKPSPTQHAWIVSDGHQQTLSGLCAQFGVPSPSESGLARAPADHEAQYLAWFEVGMPTPRVVLLASHYNRREPVPRILHEHVLFYQRFGASMREDNLDQADHLLNQLAFLVHLDELASLAPQQTQSIAAARRDFLSRHVVSLVSNASKAAEKHDAPGVYRAVLAILELAVRQDLALTEEIVTAGGSIGAVE